MSWASRHRQHEPQRSPFWEGCRARGQIRVQGNEKPQFIHFFTKDTFPEHGPQAGSWAGRPAGGLLGRGGAVSGGLLASSHGRGGRGRVGEGREGWREFAGLHACKTLPRKPSVPCLISVLLNSGQGGGPSARVGTDKTFSLCRKLASEGRLCAQHRSSLQSCCHRRRAVRGCRERGARAVRAAGTPLHPCPPSPDSGPDRPALQGCFLRLRGCCTGVT